MGLCTAIAISVLSVLAWAGWRLACWSSQQLQVKEPQTWSPVTTVIPIPMLSSGWWNYPLAAPTLLTD